MPLRDVLSQRHARHVVGRAAEHALFDRLFAPGGPLVLLLEGPSGVGKTTLLQAWAERAPPTCPAFLVVLDGLAATPAALLGRLAACTPLRFDGAAVTWAGETGAETAPPHGAANADEARDGAAFVLLLDGYDEALGPWLREAFVPALPDGARLVLAGETTDARAWRTAPALGPLVAAATLGPLGEADARALLAARGLDTAAHNAVLCFAHGHPLALVLAADALADAPPGTPFNPHGADLVGALVERFLRLAPDEGARDALRAAALVYALDEDLLAALLDLSPEAARTRFNWLRSLSFVHAGQRGLHLHALVRRVLMDDLRWRAPDRFRALHARARRHYTRRLVAVPDEQTTGLADYLFLYRDLPLVAPYFDALRAEWSRRALDGGPARDNDAPALAALVERHEGPEAARWLAAWLHRPEATCRVYRERLGTPVGLLLTLRLHATTDDGGDPAVRAALAFLHTHAPLRAGETALYFRLWGDAEAHHAVSAVQSLVFVDTIRAYLGTPGLAFSFLPATPGLWDAVFAAVGLERLDEATFAQDGQPVAVYGHDWRRVPPGDWLDGLARAGLSSTGGAPSMPVRAVFTREAFAEAVRDALRHVRRPDVLRTHPLVPTRVVAEALAEAADTPEDAVQAVLRRAADALAHAPRTRKLHDALVVTYFEPAASQEQAAERLGVPFSSYRRHLKAGVEALVEGLWRAELGGRENG